MKTSAIGSAQLRRRSGIQVSAKQRASTAGIEPLARAGEPRDQEDRDDPGLGGEPPGKRRHPAAPEDGEENGEPVAEGVVEDEAEDGDEELDTDRDRPALVLRERPPPRPHLVAEADLLGRCRHYPPSGVLSPSSPSGRKTRMRMRMVNTSDCVQSEPGAFQSSPSL